MSDPHFEFQNLRWVTVKSAALGQRADITLFVPRQAQTGAELPLILLLHGVYGSHWAWAIKGGAHRTAAKMMEEGKLPPAVLAMPSDGLWGDGSGYLPHPNQDFEAWIVEEVPAAARAAVPNMSAGSWFISGLSMGGFGALRLAAKYPQKFRGVSAHSAFENFADMARFVQEPLERYGCAAEDRSVVETMVRNRGRLPPIRFDCGTEDDLLDCNRKMSTALTSAGIRHAYAEFPGGHSWEYWGKHIADTFEFFGGILKGGRAAPDQSPA